MFMLKSTHRRALAAQKASDDRLADVREKTISGLRISQSETKTEARNLREEISMMRPYYEAGVKRRLQSEKDRAKNAAAKAALNG